MSKQNFGKITKKSCVKIKKKSKKWKKQQGIMLKITKIIFVIILIYIMEKLKTKYNFYLQNE